jgi:DNA-binding MurR/RpiR family transcriptional regulator
MEVTNQIIGDGDVLEKVLTSDAERIRRTLETIDRKSFEEAIERIIAADAIYILGVRSSSFVAGYLHFYLHLLFENVILVENSAGGEIFEQLFRIGPDDVIIAISFPRYSQTTLNVVKFARDRGASIVAITDTELSPLYPMADVSLLAPCEMISFVDSMVAPMSIINALLVSLGNRLGGIASTFMELESIWKDYGVFKRTDDE